MAQYKVWENEYQNSKLVTKNSQPQADVLRFFSFLRKEIGISLNNQSVLDLGSGTGRNSNYLAEKGNEVTGIEISDTASDIAEKRAKEKGLSVKYIRQSIGTKYPFKDNYFDLVLDNRYLFSVLDLKYLHLGVGRMRRCLYLAVLFLLRCQGIHS